MKSRISHGSHLIDFLIPGFEYKKIDQPLKEEVDKILNKYNIPELKDWEITFTALYGNRDKIFVCRKAKSQVSMKYKEIVIHIPIPSKDDVIWGVNENQIVKLKFPTDNKYCEPIDIVTGNYSNKYEFILACMRKGIKHTFKNGFTVNKIKIKPLN